MDVINRYGEQLETTVETMRRRCIAVYDGATRVGQRASRLLDGLREVAEPVVYDFKDTMTTAVQDESALDPGEIETRNNLLELFLSCSVLSVGIAGAEICGAMILGPLYDRIFDWWWEMVIVALLPYFMYLNMRKNAAIDEMERRVSILFMGMVMGSLLGHVIGPRLVSTMPASCFITPLILGLGVDSEISPDSLYSDRAKLLGGTGGAGALLSLVLLYISGVTLCNFTTLIAHAAFVAAFFQVVHYTIKNKNYGTGEAQLSYVIIELIIHIIIGGVLGSNPNNTNA